MRKSIQTENKRESSTLHIGNLPANITIYVLMEHFQKYWKNGNRRIIIKKTTNQENCLKYAFIDFDDVESAKK